VELAFYLLLINYLLLNGLQYSHNLCFLVLWNLRK